MSSASLECFIWALRYDRSIGREFASVDDDGYYDDYLHDSRCDDKSDLSARPSTIEMRGELPLRQFIGKDLGSVSTTGIDVSKALKGMNL